MQRSFSQSHPRSSIITPPRSRLILVSLLVAWLPAGATVPRAAAEPPAGGGGGVGGAIVFDMDTLRHRPTEVTGKDKQKVPCGTAELVEGKFGKAVKFSFLPDVGGFMVATVRPTPEWDRAAGFSFWVKGDGSASWGGLELIDRDDFGLRYGYCFPIDSTEWKKITVPWREVIPEMAGPLLGPDAGKADGRADANANAKAGASVAAPGDAAASYAPSRLGNFWFGKWFYWREFPAHSYAIDQVALEARIESAAPPIPAGPALGRLRAKLREHRPITVVTMGDSLTDTRHWSNRAADWPHRLAADLKARHGGAVTVVNPAMGGTTLTQNLIVMPRWSKLAPAPDLVTVWFGGNDWDSNVRGPRFADYLRLAVDRIRRQTGSSADIVLMTTCPTHARWETYAELERAAREVAKEKGVALADVAAEFRQGVTADEALKREYWAWDKIHLGARGQELAKDVVLRAIEQAP